MVAAILARIWQAISGPVTIALVIANLSVGEQGVYYALVSVISLQGCFDLGLSNLLISHFGRQGGGLLIEPQTKSKLFQSPEVVFTSQFSSELRSDRRLNLRILLRGARTWFRVTAIAFAAVACVIGYRSFNDIHSDVTWQIPLLLAIVMAAGALWLTPEMTALEGLGLREKIYRVRLAQMIVGSIAVWGTLVFVGGVWALVSATALQTIFTIWIVRSHDPFLRGVLDLRGVPDSANDTSEPIHQEERDETAPSLPLADRSAAAGRIVDKPVSLFTWKNDVLPGQWRNCLLGVIQHVSTQFFSLIILVYHGEIESAPLGLTLSMTVPIQMLAIAWLQTKFASISQLHGSHDREAAGTVWQKSTLVSASILVLAFIALGCVVGGVTAWRPDLKPRFLLPHQLALLGIGCLAIHLICSQGLYVVSRFSRPLFGANLFGYGTIGALVWAGGYWGSVDGMLWGYAIGAAAIHLPLHTASYLVSRRRS